MKNLTQILSLSLILASPLAAMAEKGGGGSEYFYQSAGGAMEATGRLIMTSSEEKQKGNAADKESGQVFEAEFEYGLSEQFSVGAILGYSMIETDDGTTKGDQTGLNDLFVYANGASAVGGGALKYGLRLGFSPGDAEIESNGDENAYSGRNNLTWMIGYETKLAAAVVGAQLSYFMGLGDGDIDNAGNKLTYSGAERTMIALFYEQAIGADMQVGAALEWYTTTDIEVDPGNNKDEYVSPTQALVVYLPTKLGSGTLLPEISYGFTTDDKVSGNDIEDYSDLTFTIGYRLPL